MNLFKEVTIDTPWLILLLWGVFTLGCLAAFVWIWLKTGREDDAEIAALKASVDAAEKMRRDFETHDLMQQVEIARLKKVLAGGRSATS
jgi:hypothetical protein